MKRRLLFIPIVVSTLLLSGCNLLPAKKGSGSTSTSDTSSQPDDNTPVVTNVTLNKTSASVKPGGILNLSATVTGKNNPDTTVEWASSATNIASISKGVVTVSSSASIGATATITATSKVTPSVSASCKITVAEEESYTILLYLCGSDLESGNGLATSDLQEILSSKLSKPDNVNFVIETGGASSWSSTYGISASKLERYHVANQKLIKDDSLSYASMGLSSTLSSFITYGLKNYPADHTGLIYWNHGGAVNGACFDEKMSYDAITASEAATAYQKGFADAGFGGKLDWVGYDCCVMSYADLAAINSDYFDFMVASQELESGYGWDYDNWLPTLYSNPGVQTSTLLKKIADTFVSDNGGNKSSNDQTLAVLDLSKMDKVTEEFEKFASGLKSTDWSSLSTSFKSSLRFGSGYDSGYYDYGLSDFKDFLTKAGSKYSTSAVSTALDEVTVYCAYASAYYKSTAPCGLNVFMAADSLRGMQIERSAYTAKDTKFTSWRDFNIDNGTFYD